MTAIKCAEEHDTVEKNQPYNCLFLGANVFLAHNQFSHQLLITTTATWKCYFIEKSRFKNNFCRRFFVFVKHAMQHKVTFAHRFHANTFCILFSLQTHVAALISWHRDAKFNFFPDSVIKFQTVKPIKHRGVLMCCSNSALIYNK